METSKRQGIFQIVDAFDTIDGSLLGTNFRTRKGDFGALPAIVQSGNRSLGPGKIFTFV